jgi:hypothetical protein
VKKREIRLAGAGLLAAVMLVALAAIAYASTDRSKPAAAQYQYGGKKVTICHKGKVTITISVNAWPAHEAHGDTVGACSGRSSGHADSDGDHGRGHGQDKPGHGHGHGHGKK